MTIRSLSASIPFITYTQISIDARPAKINSYSAPSECVKCLDLFPTWLVPALMNKPDYSSKFGGHLQRKRRLPNNASLLLSKNAYEPGLYARQHRIHDHQVAHH